MKTKATIFSVLMITLTLIFGFNAMCEETNPSQEARVYADLLDQYIANCDAKIEMKSSKLDNVRRAAAIAGLKSTFAKTYRKELIDSMIQDEIKPKSYKVQLHLNDRFYSLVRSNVQAHLSDRFFSFAPSKKSTL